MDFFQLFFSSSLLPLKNDLHGTFWRLAAARTGTAAVRWESWEGVASVEQQHGLAELSEAEHPIVQNQKNSFDFQRLSSPPNDCLPSKTSKSQDILD